MKIMKLVNLLATLFLGIIVVNSLFAQNKLYVESKIGTGNTNLSYQGDFPSLVASTGDNVFFSVGVFKSWDKGFSYGFEGEYYRFDIYMTYTPLDPIKNMGGPRFDYFAFGPKVQKDFYIFSKAGLSLSSALHLTYNSGDDYVYQGGELQTVRLSGGEPRIPVSIMGTRTVEEFTFLFKPEIGIFYNLTEHSRIMLSSKWGLDLREPSIVTDLNQIEFEEQTYHNKYFYSGNYFSLLFGYRYTF